MAHRFHSLPLRFNSIVAGMLSALLLTGLTAGMFVASTHRADAANYMACEGASRPTLRSGDRGSCVSRAQQLLAGQGVFSATANGVFGPATLAATISFQEQHGLTSDGIIGPNTWRALDGSAGVTSESSAAQPSSEFSSLPASCQRSAKTICVVKGSGSRATLYAIQDNAVVRSFPARTGDARGSEFATGEGVFKVNWKNADHVSSIYDVPMPYAMFFNGGEAIHFSEGFRGNPNGGSSHGCVNLRDIDDARWLFDWTPNGTRVVVSR